MYWCDVCECAYPHGREGPSAALKAHVDANHGSQSHEGDKAPITGRQVVIGLVGLVVAAWGARLFGFELM